MKKSDLVKFKLENNFQPVFYLLAWKDGVPPPGYDRIDALIVVAKNPNQARALAHKQATKDGGDNQPDAWLDSKFTSCHIIGAWQFKRPGVIMTSCSNG